MELILTRCGYRCDLCLAYQPNVESQPFNRQKLSDGWHQYFGFRLPPESISCDGCMAEAPRLIDQSCPVRPCVIAKGLANCAECGDYVCAKLTERLVTFEEVQNRVPMEIPADDHLCFILPYENKARLDALRNLRQPSPAINRQVLLDNIKAGYLQFKTLLDELNPVRMLQPGAIGKWSVKDTLAHIVVHEQRMLGWMETRLRGEIPAGPQPYAMPDEPLAVLNESIYAENRGRDMEDILKDFEQTHGRVLDFVSVTPDAIFFGPGCLRLEDGKPLWAAIAANTYEHMEEHGKEIREALNA